MGEEFMLRFVNALRRLNCSFPRLYANPSSLAGAGRLAAGVWLHNGSPYLLCFIFIGSEIISVPCRSLKSNLSATQGTGIFLGKGR